MVWAGLRIVWRGFRDKTVFPEACRRRGDFSGRVYPIVVMPRRPLDGDRLHPTPNMAQIAFRLAFGRRQFQPHRAVAQMHQCNRKTYSLGAASDVPVVGMVAPAPGRGKAWTPLEG